VIGPDRLKGMVFQAYTSFPWLTVLENVRFGTKYRTDINNAEKDEITRHYLDLVGLVEFADFYVNRISGGMRQRVAIARTLAAGPDILLMDEPFGALDALTREEMALEVLRIWTDEPKTILFVTHSITEAVLLADRVVVMSARPGRIAEIIDVDLPRPRTFEIEAHHEFQHATQRIRKLIFGNRSGGRAGG
jgi:NitT/TauT family transport system ATP-binding protein